MKNYLVTGAAGFIGGALAKRLVSEKHHVDTIDNLTTGFKQNVPDGVNLIEGDCADIDIYEKLPNIKYDAIFHIAGQSSGEISFDDPLYDIRTNTESTLLLLKFAQRNGCDRFIFASTMSVYGSVSDFPVSEDHPCAPESFYGVGKLASENYLRIYNKYDINTTSLRLFNVYGPGQNMLNLRQGMVSIFMAQMINDNHIHVKGSSSRFRDFVYIDDVVQSFLQCLIKKETFNQSINIASGVKTTISQLIDVMIGKYPKDVTINFSGFTQGDIHGICASTDKMKKMLGMNKTIKLEDGIERMLEWASNK